jgi:hypothetical protein
MQKNTYFKYLKKNIQFGKGGEEQIKFIYQIDDSVDYLDNAKKFLFFLRELDKTSEKKCLIQILGKIYVCKLDVMKDIGNKYTFNLHFKCGSTETVFLKIMIVGINHENETHNNFNYMHITYINTHCDFEQIMENKMNSILLIKEEFLKYFGIKNINLLDDAHFSCNKDNVNNYNAIIFRILGTNKTYDELSIYRKYGYEYRERNEILLDMIRNYDKIKFEHDIKKYLEKIEKKGKPYENFCSKLINLLDKLKEDEQNSRTVHEFFTKIDMINFCLDNRKFFIIIENILKEFFFESECSKIEENGDFFMLLNSLLNCIINLEKNY